MISVTLVPIIPQMQNYAYILEAENGEVAVVDPGEAAPIIKVLEDKGLKPDVIMITHHDWDHTGGIPAMINWHSCHVAGPEREAEKIKNLDVLLNENSDLSFGGEQVEIIETPGHTMGHICFHFPQSGVLMSADTLFSMGCGRLFEGTPQDMWASLQKILSLPDETQIYCGHEYTLSNGEFCEKIEPENAAIKARMKEVRALLERGEATLPVSLHTEKETNVFLRAGSAERFGELRALKDNA